MKNIFLTFSISNSSVTEYFLNLCNVFAKEYLVIIITDRISPHPFFVNPSIKIYKWPSQRPTHFVDFLFIINLIYKYRPSLSISLFGSVNMMIIAGFLMRIPNRIVWVRTLSSQFERNKFNESRKKIIYNMATLLIANSNATKNDVMKIFDLSNSKIQVMANAVSDCVNDFDKNAKTNPNIVFAGRLHQSKGIDVLIKAFNILHIEYPTLTLEIIGDGALRPELEKIPLDSAKKRVIFRGKVLKGEVLKSFCESLCVVIPSTAEAFGFTVIESMSMKACTIGANNTGIMEIIQDGISGLLFETGDEEDLARKIEVIYRDENLRNYLSQGGYKRFQDHYSTQVAIKRDFNFFQKLLC